MSLHTRVRRGLAATLAAGLVAPGLVALATAPAHAEPVTVTDAQFRWGFDNESNNAGFAPGTYNFFSAGKIGDPGAGGLTLSNADEGTTWSNGEPAGWTASSGNVTIEKEQADGLFAPTTWTGLKTGPDGSPVTVGNNVFSNHEVVVDSGVGTLDAAADDARITWDGGFSVVYYSGMTFFYVSDPVLTVDGGEGSVTATLSGYGTSMDDTSQWIELAPTEVTLATLSDVDVTETGLVATPSYLGVEYDAPEGVTPQNRTGDHWGAFPQSFIDFQQQTGQSSYWYSSGGAADPRKVTLPLQVTRPVEEPASATVSVSQTKVLNSGATTVTIQGAGFDPGEATGARPPLAGRPAGAYVAFGKVADIWRPSEGAPGSSRVNSSVQWAVLAEDMESVGGPAAGAIALRPDGTFTAQLTVDKAAIDAKATDSTLTRYGIVTYAGSGAVAAAYETFTPITFVKATPTVKVTTRPTTYGKAGTATVAVTATRGVTGTVTLQDGSTSLGRKTLNGGTARFTLRKTLKPGSHLLTATYAGNDTVAAAATKARVAVAKAKPSLRTSWGKKPRTKAKSALAIKVGGPAGVMKPSGKVIVKIVRGGKSISVRGALKNGSVRVAISKAEAKKLGKGTWRTTVTYPGNGYYAGARKTLSVKVR